MNKVLSDLQKQFIPTEPSEDVLEMGERADKLLSGITLRVPNVCPNRVAITVVHRGQVIETFKMNGRNRDLGPIIVSQGEWLKSNGMTTIRVAGVKSAKALFLCTEHYERTCKLRSCVKNRSIIITVVTKDDE